MSEWEFEHWKAFLLQSSKRDEPDTTATIDGIERHLDESRAELLRMKADGRLSTEHFEDAMERLEAKRRVMLKTD